MTSYYPPLNPPPSPFAVPASVGIIANFPSKMPRPVPAFVHRICHCPVLLSHPLASAKSLLFVGITMKVAMSIVNVAAAIATHCSLYVCSLGPCAYVWYHLVRSLSPVGNGVALEQRWRILSMQLPGCRGPRPWVAFPCIGPQEDHPSPSSRGSRSVPLPSRP